MQMTTREAVEEALYALAFEFRMTPESSLKQKEAARVLCAYYGFSFEQFFDVKETA